MEWRAGSVETVRSPKRRIMRSPTQDCGLSAKTMIFLSSFHLGSSQTSCLSKDSTGYKNEKTTKKKNETPKGSHEEAERITSQITMALLFR